MDIVAAFVVIKNVMESNNLAFWLCDKQRVYGSNLKGKSCGEICCCQKIFANG